MGFSFSSLLVEVGEGRRSLEIGIGFANEQYLQKLPLWLVQIQTGPFS